MGRSRYVQEQWHLASMYDAFFHFDEEQLTYMLLMARRPLPCCCGWIDAYYKRKEAHLDASTFRLLISPEELIQRTVKMVSPADLQRGAQTPVVLTRGHCHIQISGVASVSLLHRYPLHHIRYAKVGTHVIYGRPISLVSVFIMGRQFPFNIYGLKDPWEFKKALFEAVQARKLKLRTEPPPAPRPRPSSNAIIVYNNAYLADVIARNSEHAKAAFARVMQRHGLAPMQTPSNHAPTRQASGPAFTGQASGPGSSLGRGRSIGSSGGRTCTSSGKLAAVPEDHPPAASPPGSTPDSDSAVQGSPRSLTQDEVHVEYAGLDACDRNVMPTVEEPAGTSSSTGHLVPDAHGTVRPMDSSAGELPEDGQNKAEAGNGQKEITVIAAREEAPVASESKQESCGLVESLDMQQAAQPCAAGLEAAIGRSTVVASGVGNGEASATRPASRHSAVQPRGRQMEAGLGEGSIPAKNRFGGQAGRGEGKALTTAPQHSFSNPLFVDVPEDL